MNTSIIAESPEVREAVEKWAWAYIARRVDLTTEAAADEGFQQWAAFEIERGPWDMADCLRKATEDELEATAPTFPQIASPAWAVEVEIGSESGGEVYVEFLGRRHESGTVSARLMWSCYVVVGENRIPGEEGFDQGDPIGAVHWQDSLPEVKLDGVDFTDSLTDWWIVADTARVLSGIAAQMKLEAVGS